MRTDSALRLPPVDEVKNFDDVREYLKKVSALLNNNQADLFSDLYNTVTISGKQTITGEKTLGANLNCNQRQLIGLVIENRTSDPVHPVDGQIWYRSDL